MLVSDGWLWAHLVLKVGLHRLQCYIAHTGGSLRLLGRPLLHSLHMTISTYQYL